MQPIPGGAIITESVWSLWIFFFFCLQILYLFEVQRAQLSHWHFHSHSLQFQTRGSKSHAIVCTWESSKWEQSGTKRTKKKKVCSLLMSAVTSHSAHFHHLPLSFSFCWQIKIHGLPSHPFSLLCLIVSKIEEITKSNLCTNKNLSESWQCIPRHARTHTHTRKYAQAVWYEIPGPGDGTNSSSFVISSPLLQLITQSKRNQ